MFTLSTAFDSGVFYIMRCLVKHTPEDARRIEKELIELRKSVEEKKVLKAESTAEDE